MPSKPTCATRGCDAPAIGLVVCHSHEGPHEDDQHNGYSDLCEDCEFALYVREMNEWHAWGEYAQAMTGQPLPAWVG